MATWTRQPQERPGNYFFSGQFLVTREVTIEVPASDIMLMYLEIQDLVALHDGLDYLQVFVDKNGRKLFFIDQLSKDMIESGDFDKRHNHCTLMFAHEY